MPPQIATPRYGNVARVRWLTTYVLLPLARFLDWLLCKRRCGLRLLEPTRLIHTRLDPRRLMRNAQKLARSDAFHLPSPFIEQRLVSAQHALRDADLAGLGAPGDLVVGLPAVAVLERRLTRSLVADLHVTRALSLAPAYFAAPPGEHALIITGPPRSGTTLLLELLACDTDTWRPLTGPEALLPCVVDGAAAHVLTGALAGQALAFQSTADAHFEDVAGPTECRSLLENAGAPYVLWWVLGLTQPLDAWLGDASQRRSDYLFYRRQLAAVRLAAAGGRGEACDRRRWLLKDPCHLFSLDELFGALPNARVVWLHRDPATAAASLCSLLARVWRLLYRTDASVHPPRFHEKVVAYLGKLLDAGLAFRRRRPGAAVHDLSYRDLAADPLLEVARIYAFAGETLSDAARARMEAHLAARARAPRHVYAAADFGLEPADLDRRFAAYKREFGV